MLSAIERPSIRSATKVCVDCGVEKTVEAFTVNGRWRKSWCKECDCQRAKKRREGIKCASKVFVERKICPGCGNTRERESFCIVRSNRDGLSVYCRLCRKAKMAEAYKKIQLKLPEVEYKICPECRQSKSVAEFYREPKKRDGLSRECRKCKGIKCKEWSGRNPDKARALWSKKNKRYAKDGRYRTYARRWRARHPNHWKEYYRLNFERDRDKLWLRDQRRRARLAGLPWNFSSGDKADVMEMFEHACAFCGSANELTMEHVVPVDRRDVPNPGTVRGNLIPLCKLCNDSKGTKLLDEYLLNPKMLRPQISEHLQARGVTANALMVEISFLQHMLNKS